MLKRCRLSEWSRSCAPQLAAKDKVSTMVFTGMYSILLVRLAKRNPSCICYFLYTRLIASRSAFDCVITPVLFQLMPQHPRNRTLSACSRYGMQPCYAMAKQLHFNKDGSALKKMQAGVDKLASVVGITLGPKVLFLSLLTRWAAGRASVA